MASKGRIPPPTRGPEGHFIGGLSQIINSFPDESLKLEKTPRRIKEPNTDLKEKEPSDRNQSALRVVEFWQDFRNQVVHSDRQASVVFVNKHREVWDLLRSDLRGIPPLKKDLPIPLNTTLVTASFSTHGVLARKMRDILIAFSKEKRGHVFAPGAFKGKLKPEQMPDRIPHIWMMGDW